MSPKDFDSELTRLFEEQRRADEASAPEFRELMTRTRASTRGHRIDSQARRGRWARRLSAAAALVAVALGLSLLRRPPEPLVLSNAPALADWKAPTDVLLQTPGAELLGRVPDLLTCDACGEADEGAGAPRQSEATPRSTQTKRPNRKGVES